MKKRLVIFAAAMAIFAMAGCEKEQAEDTADQPGVYTEETEEPTDVSPLPSKISLDEITDGVLAVSLKNGDIYSDGSEALKIKVTVYDYEVFDPAEISKLAAGDMIELNREQVTIETLEINELGTVMINGGLDAGGYELVTNEDGEYYSIGYSDVKNYEEIGETELEISSDFVYVDASDLENGENEYTLSDLTGSAQAVNYEGTPYNTTIVVENGMVTSMVKRYIP